MPCSFLEQGVELGTIFFPKGYFADVAEHLKRLGEGAEIGRAAFPTRAIKHDNIAYYADCGPNVPTLPTFSEEGGGLPAAPLLQRP